MVMYLRALEVWESGMAKQNIVLLIIDPLILQTTKFIDMEAHYTISLIILAPWFILGAWEILQAIKEKLAWN